MTVVHGNTTLQVLLQNSAVQNNAIQKVQFKIAVLFNTAAVI